MVKKMESRKEMFYRAFEKLYLGLSITDNASGFANLLRIKKLYYDEIKAKLENKIQEVIGDNEQVERILYNRLYNFFNRYITSYGSVFYAKSRFNEKIFEELYDQNPKLFWKTNLLYYFKTSREFNDMTVQFEEYKLNFECINLGYALENKNKEVFFKLKNIDENEITIAALFKQTKPSRTGYHNIIRKLKKLKIIFTRSYLEDIFNEFNRMRLRNPFKNNQSEYNIVQKTRDGWEFNFILMNFDPTHLEYETREATFNLYRTEGKIIYFYAYFPGTNPQTTNYDYFIRQFQDAGIEINKSLLKKAFITFKKQERIDYFVNKDAKRFLDENFNFWMYCFLFENNEDFSNQELTQLNKIKEIGLFIIELISNFEDELLKILKKPRFVIESNYVICVDTLLELPDGDEILDKILEHENFDNQFTEWKLEPQGFIANEETLDSLIDNIRSEAETGKKRIKYRFLPLDTKYFKDLELEILSKIDNIDEKINGWLIWSENLQTLNTILPKFREKIKLIFIDPPFNIESPDYFFLENFKDSTYISLLENRFELSDDFLVNNGWIMLRCESHGNMFAKLIMDNIFGENNFRNEILVGKTKGNKKMGVTFPLDKDSLILYAKSEDSELNDVSIYNEKRQIIKKVLMELNKLLDRDLRTVKNDALGRRNENLETYFEDTISRYENVTDCWCYINGYGQSWDLKTENSEQLLERVILATTTEDDIVLDYFLGSGSAISTAHKRGRRWIGVEVADHFNRVALPRMKHVLAGSSKGASKVSGNKGGLFKYFQLESYEDILGKLYYYNEVEGESWKKYIFLKEDKMSNKIEEEFDVDLMTFITERSIDLAETLSQLCGKYIKKINEAEVEFDDDVIVNFFSINYQKIKDLFWW